MIIFIHIAKTGGATLNGILETVYKNEYFRVKLPAFASDINYCRANPHKCVSGHFSYGIHNDLGAKDYRYITLLRNPVQKVKSYYYYMRFRDNKKMGEHHLDIAAKKSTLAQFAALEFTELDNEMIRKLIPNPPGYGEINHIHLEQAVENLQNITFGITEKYETSLGLFENVLNWEKIPDYEKRNISKNKKPMNDDEMELIAGINSYDLQLYEYAVNNFESQFIEE